MRRLYLLKPRRQHHRAKPRYLGRFEGGMKSPLILRPLNKRTSIRTKGPILTTREKRVVIALKKAHTPTNIRSRITAMQRYGVTVKDLKDQINQFNPKHHIHCLKRKLRKTVLFSLGIAGKNLSKSPGSGGTYRRTEESNMRC